MRTIFLHSIKFLIITELTNSSMSGKRYNPCEVNIFVLWHLKCQLFPSAEQTSFIHSFRPRFGFTETLEIATYIYSYNF